VNENNEWPERGYYPGSRVPLPSANEPPAEPETEPVGWDSRPYKKFVSGKEVEFFTIGAPAKALNKSVVTLRHWIKKGYFPQSNYRLPEKNGIAGRRLYTRPQIEALIAIATKHDIVDGSRVDWSKHKTFAREVREAWSQLPPL
jgi:hypothetical protein